MASTIMTNTSSSPSIKFYTNKGCPWSQRAQITLRELSLPYEEILIDLDAPRPDWYLKLNPTGTVPALQYSSGPVVKDALLTESAVVTQFLTDAHRPSHLTHPEHIGDDPTATALFRARAAFFVETFMSKTPALSYKLLLAEEKEEQEKAAEEMVKVVGEHLEPLLADAGPFFGGAKRLTVAELYTASFVHRLYLYTRKGLYPASLTDGLDRLPNFSRWAKAVINHESVLFNIDEPWLIEGTYKRKAKLRSKSK